ncbi:MAG: ABC transporter ATP-binding protein [Rhizobiaceae bacterium]
MLEVKGLDAFYGDSHVLHGVDLAIGTGGRVAVLGRNGAGKSTLLKSILGAGPTTKGTIAWDGQDISALPVHKRARLGLCLVPEDRQILPDLTVIENIEMALRGAGNAGKQSAASIVARYQMLIPIRDRLGGVLSGGQQQLLALARADAAGPKLLLLDEPTEGLAPIIVESLVEHVRNIVAQGGGLCLCEQNIWFSRQCTDRVCVLDTGRMVFSGTWAEFDADPDIKNKYLAV